MVRVKREREPYSDFLPPVACEKAMAQRVAAVARANKVSQAEIIRQAVALFLGNVNQKMGDAKPKSERQSARAARDERP